MAIHPSESLPELSLPEAWSIVGEPVESVTALGTGNRSRVYRVELSDGTTRVIRLSPRGTGRTARESWVRRRMAGDPDLPTVHATSVVDVPLAESVDITVMNELPGESMVDALRRGPPERSAELWEHFGGGLGALHAVVVDAYGLLDGSGHGTQGSWRDAVVAITRAALDDARATGLADLCPSASAVLTGLLPSLDAVTSPRLLHGDAQTTNVQVRDGRVVAWLDFEFAMGGDPLYELAFVSLLLDDERVVGVSPWAAMARGYVRRQPWPEEVPARMRGYKIVHCLRGAELLRVMGPSMTIEDHEIATARLRGVLRHLLDT